MSALNNPLVLEIGKPAPRFAAEAYIKGKFRPLTSEHLRDKYIVLFFYPYNYTHICTSELMAFQKIYSKFAKCNTVVVGCSVDSKYSHMNWSKTPLHDAGLAELEFPLLADIDKEITKSYNSLMDFGRHEGTAMRSTFIIDTKGILRHMSYNDIAIERNAEEILRLVQAFQHFDENGELCPAKWRKKGDKTLKGGHDEKETVEYFTKVHGK
jgi:peroxiredoxin (alkyl hydroperoxide reductase subunit C)